MVLPPPLNSGGGVGAGRKNLSSFCGGWGIFKFQGRGAGLSGGGGLIFQEGGGLDIFENENKSYS